MRTEQEITRGIMRRVYAIYWLRQLMKPSVRLAAFAALVVAMASSVSLPNIIANALGTSDLVGFSIAAVSNTTLSIQLGVLLTGSIIVWTLVDLFHAPSHARFST